MKFCIGIAGVPRPHFDDVYKNQRRFLSDNCNLVSETLKSTDPAYYFKGHANFFLKEFHSRLASDHQNQLSDTFFAILYVSAGDLSDRFASQFFPSILTIPLDWTPRSGTRTIRGASSNELIGKLRNAVLHAQNVARALKRELGEQDQKTPWLLPPKNFTSKVYRSLLAQLHERLRLGSSIEENLQRASNEFKRHHPPQRLGKSNRACFVDNRRIEFHPPGQARHAYARANYAGHPKSCLLNGRRRLGYPYDRAFHFDCQSGNGKLVADMYNCHSDLERFSGRPHLNVAPNDNVRI